MIPGNEGEILVVSQKKLILHKKRKGVCRATEASDPGKQTKYKGEEAEKEEAQGRTGREEGGWVYPRSPK